MDFRDNVAGSSLGDEGTGNVKCNDFHKSPLKQFSVFAIFFFFFYSTLFLIGNMKLF